MSLQFTVTLDEAEVNAIIQRATEEVRALATKSLTAQLIAPMVKERIAPEESAAVHKETRIEEEIGADRYGQPYNSYSGDHHIVNYSPDRERSQLWADFWFLVRKKSVPTAALLEQKARIMTWWPNQLVILVMEKPFAEQFRRQHVKANLIIDAFRELLGSGTDVQIRTGSDSIDLQYTYQEPQSAVIEQALITKKDLGKATLDTFEKIFHLVKSGFWHYLPNEGFQDISNRGSRRMAVKWCSLTATSAGTADAVLYWLPRTPDVCYIDHNNPHVRMTLGPRPYAAIAEWDKFGLIKKLKRGQATGKKNIRGLSKQVVAIELKTLQMMNIDTSWACEP
jgi:hypothetical protein